MIKVADGFKYCPRELRKLHHIVKLSLVFKSIIAFSDRKKHSKQWQQGVKAHLVAFILQI